jgi:hypothetical protein
MVGIRGATGLWAITPLEQLVHSIDVLWNYLARAIEAARAEYQGFISHYVQAKRALVLAQFTETIRLSMNWDQYSVLRKVAQGAEKERFRGVALLQQSGRHVLQKSYGC